MGISVSKSSVFTELENRSLNKKLGKDKENIENKKNFDKRMCDTLQARRDHGQLQLPSITCPQHILHTAPITFGHTTTNATTSNHQVHKKIVNNVKKSLIHQQQQQYTSPEMQNFKKQSQNHQSKEQVASTQPIKHQGTSQTSSTQVNPTNSSIKTQAKSDKIQQNSCNVQVRDHFQIIHSSDVEQKNCQDKQCKHHIPKVLTLSNKFAQMCSNMQQSRINDNQNRFKLPRMNIGRGSKCQ